MPSFSERIKDLRKSRSVTQKLLASEVGMSERNYQDLEYGRIKPSHDNIIKFAEYFGVSADYLLGLSDDPARR